ncbi:hypothetical protein ACI2J7_01315 [Serratia bockelmannii]|uniref:hypothetical protein n=1 Tax=Serratia bockelmannii TaxID=2703793 RepID=UPI00384BFEA7
MTLTTERMAEIAKLAIRLQQISSCAAVTGSGETVLHHTHVNEILSALHDVTSELLANREAQPVLYASEETLAYAKEGEKSLVTWSEPMGDAVIPLFTVPKAQTSGVVNLPTEFISDEGVMVRLEQVMAALALVGVKYERRGDACRAAMLNHVGDANEKAAEKCECSSIDYCDNCLRAMLDQPVNSGYKLVPVDFLTTASRLIDLCRTYSILSDGGNYKERTISECESTMEVIDGLLTAAPESGNGA